MLSSTHPFIFIHRHEYIVKVIQFRQTLVIIHQFVLVLQIECGHLGCALPLPRESFQHTLLEWYWWVVFTEPAIDDATNMPPLFDLLQWFFCLHSINTCISTHITMAKTFLLTATQPACSALVVPSSRSLWSFAGDHWHRVWKQVTRYHAYPYRLAFWSCLANHWSCIRRRCPLSNEACAFISRTKAWHIWPVIECRGFIMSEICTYVRLATAGETSPSHWHRHPTHPHHRWPLSSSSLNSDPS